MDERGMMIITTDTVDVPRHRDPGTTAGQSGEERRRMSTRESRVGRDRGGNGEEIK